jgi:hypothetical protein
MEETLNNTMPRPEVKLVPVRGVNIETFRRGEDEPYVSVRALAHGLGLDVASQLKRIERDAVLRSSMVMTPAVGADRRNREMQAIPLAMVPGFLFGIDASRVRPDLQDRLNGFKRECYAVLDQYWRGGGVAANPRVVGLSELSEDVRAVIGGIVKSVVAKALEDVHAGQELISERLLVVAERVDTIMAPGPNLMVTVDHVTAFDVVSVMAEVPDGKRYPGLSSWVSTELQRFCVRNGFSTKLIPIYPGEKWAFHRDAALRWLAEGGRKAIWERVSRRAERRGGQGRLRLAGGHHCLATV